MILPYLVSEGPMSDSIKAADTTLTDSNLVDPTTGDVTELIVVHISVAVSLSGLKYLNG